MTGLQAAGVRLQRVRRALSARALSAYVLGAMMAAALLAPAIAPYDPHEQHAAYPYAPPMRPHVVDLDGSWHAPFVYRIQLADRLERRYLEDRSRRVPLLRGAAGDPVFLLGTDALGRDVLSRLLYGARASLGIAALATLGALAIGALVGALAGYAGGVADEAAMRTADLVLVLPAIYVVLALRAAMPLVLSPAQVFAGLSIVLALVGWPTVARGVRAIVAGERRRDYAEAARASGASAARVLFVHLLPAARGFIATQAALLVPAFVLAEATLSFVGFGFAEPVPSWGTLLQEAGSVRAFAEFPWLLSPVVAIAIVCLAVNISFASSYEKDASVPF